MILIISKSNYETTTEKVIDWLEYYNASYFRLNGTDFYNKLIQKNDEYEFDNCAIDDVNVIWNRRWLDEEYISDKLSTASLDNKNYLELHRNLMRDLIFLKRYFFKMLAEKRWITKPKELTIYKALQLEIAKSVGLKIPNTLTTSSKSELERFLAENERIITKSISDPASFLSTANGKSQFHITHTIEIDAAIIETLNDTFFPSLFQKLIDKKFEIRVFYLNKKFYSMAIFSQLDDQTKLDFRNYNKKTPNRNVPFKLPVSIEEKLQKFIDHFQFTTGSFDLIYSKENEFIFLEINPVGQFGMTSQPTNYNLEKILAKHLITIDENRRKKL